MQHTENIICSNRPYGKSQFYSIIGTSPLRKEKGTQMNNEQLLVIWGLIVGLVVVGTVGEAQESHTQRIELTAHEHAKVVSAQAKSGSLAGAENILDGDSQTSFTFQWGNGGASVLIDLGRPCVLESAVVTNGLSNPLVWLDEISVGPDKEHMRKLLGRPINLAERRPGTRPPAATTEIPLPSSVARYVRVSFRGGGAQGEIAEVALFGRKNFPERHLMFWWGDLQQDVLDKMDYLDQELGVTDLWLDYVASAFPQSSHNSGFDMWVESGALDEFRNRGIRYWLGEHEAFCQMVSCPEDLKDDRKWETLFRQMRHIYTQARNLGFRGLVLDAEDYNGVSQAAWDKYIDGADHVNAWCFADQFGYAGLYYQRGLQYGRALERVWDCPVIQVYEARMYAGKDDCQAGNYWWLKGIHDAGIEIWIATGKTYGAGENEISREHVSLDHLRRWFVWLPEFIGTVYQAYPFAARVLPGFHPWNTRLQAPNYLPKYLDEQLNMAGNCAQGYWIYTEGVREGADPREVLKPEILQRYEITAEDYLDIFRAHPTSRNRF